MRICFYADFFLPEVGGSQMVLHNLATQLTRRGDTALVLAPRVDHAGPHVDFPYPVHRYPRLLSRRFGVRQTLPQLLQLYWRYRFDVLHCFSGYPSAYVGATFKRLCAVPLVVRPYGGDDIRPGGRTRRHPRLARRLHTALTAADAVIAQGRFLQDILRDLGVAEQRLHVIHNGIDLAAFTTDIPFPHPRPYILGLGKLTYHKGFDVLLKAYARLSNPAPDLLIAGSGDEAQPLQQLAATLGIAQRVTFLGWIDGMDKIRLLRSALCFVCPSRREPFANVLLEALAAGLPVVASNAGGNPELVHHDAHGLLFPSEDEAALAQILGQLLDTPALLTRLRSAVPGFVRQFDWPLVVERFLHIYQEVCRRGATG